MILKQDQQTALNQLNESNDKAMIEMSEQYKSKLIVEYQKYSGLEEMYTSIKKSYDKKMGAVEKATKVCFYFLMGQSRHSCLRPSRLMIIISSLKAIESREGGSITVPLTSCLTGLDLTK